MNILVKKYKQFRQATTSIDWTQNSDEEKKFLYKLYLKRKKEDNCPFVNSMYQYKAQVYYLSFWQKTAQQLIAFFTLIYLFVMILFKKRKNKKFYEKYDVGYFYIEKIFSTKIKENKRLKLIGNDDLYLTRKDVFFILKYLFKSRFNFFLCSVSLFRISQVSYAINVCKIDEVWTNMEYSCACGLVHKYCQLSNVTMSNFMHGEKIFCLRDSFVSFDFFYVWDDVYIDLFKEMYCAENIQFIIDNVYSSNIELERLKSKKLCYFLIGNETSIDLERISSILKILEDFGYEIYVKDHPRNQHKSSYLKFPCLKSSTPIDEVFMDFGYVMAQYSTVLIEGFYSNKNIIIDNFTNPTIFKSLKDRGWGKKFEEKSNVKCISEIIDFSLLC